MPVDTPTPGTLAQNIALLALLWLAINMAILAAYRREIARLWREPVFGVPVLVVDSDDWGAGPLEQADALREIADVLERHRDASGRPAVLNLALVLSVPDGSAVGANGTYRRVCLDDPRFAPVLNALRDGVSRNVFALQLHGLEHYWPDALMASDEDSIRTWLRQPGPASTETLPAHLQSRWVDASVLPSRPLLAAAIDAAARLEAEVFTRIFGQPPAVVVPPTFVWTRVVEQAWEANGVECVVTPGRRFTGRDITGKPAGGEGPFSNGDLAGNLVYLVRCDYFEPSRGRGASHALKALERCVLQGKPCILENHRDNFLGERTKRQKGLDELERMLSEGLRRYPGLRFLSGWDTASALRSHDSKWLATRPRERLPFVWARLQDSGRLWKLMRLTGLSLVGAALVSSFGQPTGSGAPCNGRHPSRPPIA